MRAGSVLGRLARVELDTRHRRRYVLAELVWSKEVEELGDLERLARLAL